LLAFARDRAPREGITPAASAPVTAQSNQPQKITITRSGARTSSKGPEANFTGAVSVEMLFPANAPARAAGASVTFEPGARSAWHTHPLGQILIVTSGAGWVQQEGGEKQEIKLGDVVGNSQGARL
jgi:quercetin dioxygenase-like cupin family protein